MRYARHEYVSFNQSNRVIYESVATMKIRISLVIPPFAQVLPLVIHGHAGLLPFLLHIISNSLGSFQHSQDVLSCQTCQLSLLPSATDQLGKLFNDMGKGSCD